VHKGDGVYVVVQFSAFCLSVVVLFCVGLTNRYTMIRHNYGIAMATILTSPKANARSCSAL
jgi:hypothetical protein